MNTNYSQSIANAINNFFTEDDWNFSFDDQGGLFELNLNMKGKLKKISYIIDVKEDAYIVYAISPLGADDSDEKMMTSMAEFVCRANYGIKNGNFELDMRDGEIRYKTFVDCEGLTPSREVVKNSILCPAAMFSRYGAGILDIIFGCMSAKEVIETCEKTQAKKMLARVGEEPEGSEDTNAGIVGLADRIGIEESDRRSDDEYSISTDVVTDVKTDLFAAKGSVIQ